MYDFNQVLDRTGTDCAKWDNKKCQSGMLGMWVADMDFPVLPEITQAIQQRAAHPIYGYTYPSHAYRNSVIDWLSRRHGLKADSRSIVITSGVVPALRLAVEAYTRPQDEIVLCRPVYFPFSAAIEDAGRKLVNVPLLADGSMDLAGLEQAFQTAKMMILCSPHNPTGRIWTPEELQQLCALAKKHGVFLVSDEIHMDIVQPGMKHTPLWVANPEIMSQSILCTAPSKTFNLAGLATSNILIADEGLRKQFVDVQHRYGADSLNVFGLTACEAALTHGDVWVNEMNAYVADNFALMDRFFQTRMPEVKMTPHEGTYLAWVDFRAWDVEDLDALMEQAGLFLDGGTMFGPEGKGFQRFNLACPRSVVQEALDRLLAVRPCR